ncbi:MAG: bifunctional nuclease family protein [candidate division WOR-3 bacterium]|uniref:Bifunctional nuclease family protein n=1 Tax=candidate division WOR-3 bacterium TaxID=2052148 RepID=A0A7C3IUE9_UNCW3|nr:bifunctional nuclease family protein [candidate division WOR-3 bacterium]
MIEVRVEAVLIEQSSNTPVMLLREVGGSRVLPVFIGPAEASAIIYALEKTQFVRPLTLDLMRNVITGLNGRVRQVVINRLDDETFFAELVLESGEQLVAIDARPSDSVGLALRVGAPIFVEDEVMERAGQWLSDEEETRLKELRERMRKVEPEDFGNYQI